MEKRRVVGYAVAVIAGALFTGALGFLCCLSYLISGIVVVGVLRLFTKKIEYGEAFSLGIVTGGLGALLHYEILMYAYRAMPIGSLFNIPDMALRGGAFTLVFFGGATTVVSCLIGVALLGRMEKKEARSTAAEGPRNYF